MLNLQNLPDFDVKIVSQSEDMQLEASSTWSFEHDLTGSVIKAFTSQLYHIEFYFPSLQGTNLPRKCLPVCHHTHDDFYLVLLEYPIYPLNSSSWYAVPYGISEIRYNFIQYKCFLTLVDILVTCLSTYDIWFVRQCCHSMSRWRV
jgi:hypothetical protein